MWFREVPEATRRGEVMWKFSLERGGSSWTLKDGQSLTRGRAGGRVRQLEPEAIIMVFEKTAGSQFI